MKSSITFLFCCWAAAAASQKFDRNRLDSLFDLLAANQKAMGSLSIFKNGKEVYQRSIGWADIPAQRAADASTQYRIGSISKTFTATLILQLVEEGKLTLDAKLSSYFPEIQHADKITIQQLLQHRSGIFNITDVEDYPTWMEQPISRETMLAKIKAAGSSFEPGTQSGYSNSAYILLTFIAEDITKKTYATLLQERIATPLRLTQTRYGGKIATDKNEAQSYQWLTEWEQASETDISVPQGAGAIVSTPGDLNRFLHALFSGKLVSKESLQKMMTLNGSFGLGMFPVPFYERTAWGHTGGIDGFQSNAFYFPKEKISIAYTSNGVAFPMNDILIGVLSIYFGMPYELPKFAPVLKLSSEELDPYLGVYSSPDFPLKLSITKEDKVLMAQATGQMSFPIEAYEKHKFKSDMAKLTIEFFPEEGRLVLLQGGASIELRKNQD